VRRTSTNDAFAQMYESEMMGKPLPDCPEALKLKTVGGGKGSHMEYNSDGHLVKAAACFIAARYKNTAGT
jgi:hypothetical protein